MTVERGCLLKDDGDHRLDVVHRDGLSVELSLLGVLILGDVLIGRLCPCSSGIRPSSSRLGLVGGGFSGSDGLRGRLLEFGVGRHGSRLDWTCRGAWRGRGRSRRRSRSGRGWSRGA